MSEEKLKSFRDVYVIRQGRIQLYKRTSQGTQYQSDSWYAYFKIPGEKPIRRSLKTSDKLEAESRAETQYFELVQKSKRGISLKSNQFIPVANAYLRDFEDKVSVRIVVSIFLLCMPFLPLAATKGNRIFFDSFIELPQYTVVAIIGPNGTVSPGSNQLVREGRVVQYQLSPDTGYKPKEPTGTCGGELAETNFTTAPILGDCDISFTFDRILKHSITTIAGEGGVINPSAQIVEHGQMAEFTVIPDEGHIIGSVTGCGGLMTDSNTFTIPMMMEDCQITAAFKVVMAQSIWNDTGIDWCSNDWRNWLDCPLDSYPYQDGDYGRDALARHGRLAKVGAGAAGFDFTKLDANGHDLPASAPSWVCVRDNHTGLIWETKVNDRTHLRHYEHTYSWYNPDTSTNGGFAGIQNGGDCAANWWETPTGCDTHAFVQAVNSHSLCGATGWRMPTWIELHSISHQGTAHPSIDSDYFGLTTPSSLESAAWYFWSATPVAASTGSSSSAWRFYFRDGSDESASKGGHYRARLVLGTTGSLMLDQTATLAEDECSNHAGPRTTPSGAFNVIGDGSIVRHELTFLEWQRCAVGQDWNGSTCTGSASLHNWHQAVQIAADAGEGWRLPNINELRSIVELCRVGAINSIVFPNNPSSWFWSASPAQYGWGSEAWALSYYYGGSSTYGKGMPFRIRLVRDAE